VFAIPFVLGLLCGVAVTWWVLRSRLRESAAAADEEARVDRAEAAERMAELATLTGGLAHEIRNPLSTLKVNFQLLAEDWQEATDAAESDLCRRSLAKIETLRDEADRLQVILDDFLQYLGKQELHVARADLNELVDDLLVFFRPQALAQNVQVRESLHGEPLICELDVPKIKQALLNLFVNAQQAMPAGGELIVRTSIEPTSPVSDAEPSDLPGDSRACVEVVDTGCGIPANELDKIFQPYYSTKREGTGLGLPTTRRIVRAHHGDVMVDGEPGRGSRFTVRLPLAAGEA
jgi:signal transduction histidine kinase